MTFALLSEGDAMLAEPVKKKPKRKKGLSPNTLSIRKLEAEGWSCGLVEQRLPGCFITRDFLGCLDIVGVKDGVTMGLQVTTDNGGNVAKRVAKMGESEHIAALRKANWRLVVWGWKDQETYREVDVS